MYNYKHKHHHNDKILSLFKIRIATILSFLSLFIFNSKLSLCWVAVPSLQSPSSSRSSIKYIKSNSMFPALTRNTQIYSSSSSTNDSNSGVVDPVYYGGNGNKNDNNDPIMLSLLSSNKDNKQQNQQKQKVTLTRYLNDIVQEQPELRELESLLLSVQMACKTISNMLNRSELTTTTTTSSSQSQQQQSDYRSRSMKRLDQICTNVIKNALKFTGKVSTIACTKNDNSDDGEEDQPKEHQPGVLLLNNDNDNESTKQNGNKGKSTKYITYIDPLDGSGNADAGIPTGTIFGIFPYKQDHNDNKSSQHNNDNDNLIQNVLQPGNHLQGAGYCLYSSSTIFIFSIKSINNGTVHSFTLDPSIGEFILTTTDLSIPENNNDNDDITSLASSSTNVYSCNEANSIGWDKHIQDYIYALKSGNNISNRRYALRYIGSMVADIHRTIVYGGIFMYPKDTISNPRGNIQLLYKSMPLGYILQNAGGACTNGEVRLMDVEPGSIHQRCPCFMGSKLDMKELLSYVPHCKDIVL